MKATTYVALALAVLSVSACSRGRNTTALAETTLSAAQQTTAAQPTPAKPTGPTRTERDLLGPKEVPADAYYGVQTMRAIENFPISGIAINHYPGFVEAWAIVKLAAARANTDVGAMKKEKLDAIEKAADAVLKGEYRDQFV